MRAQLFIAALLFTGIHVSGQTSSNAGEPIDGIPTSGLTFNDYSQWTDVNGTLYFVLQNTQLWKVAESDPTAVLLAELESIRNLANVNGELFFAASDGIHGMEIWKSDGTQAGTIMVKDIHPGSSGSDPSMFTYANGLAFFSADDGATGRELWKSDGTAGGTVIVKDLMRVVGNSNPSNLVSMNGWLYYVANDGQHGYEVWKTDGTWAGTQLVKDIRPQHKVGSLPRELVNVNGKLFFAAYDNFTIRRLWVSDGSDSGTVMVKDAGTDSTSTEPGLVEYMVEPAWLTNVDGTLYFVGRHFDHGTELWKSDGTAAGTVMVKDIVPGVGSPQYLHYLTGNEDRLYFIAGTTRDLWISDGTEAGTIALTQHPNIRMTGFPDLTPFKGLVYFIAESDASTINIFRAAETPGSVESYIESTEGYYSLTNLTASGNYLYYVNEGSLWRTDGEGNDSASARSRSIAESIAPALTINSGEEQVSSYPNPFISDFVLNVSGKDGGTYDANIINTKGEIAGEYTDLFFNNDYPIGGGLASGVYILRVREGKNTVTKKIIKTQ